MLELKIIEGIRPDNPTSKYKVFNAGGGVIGRDAHCAWVLFDRQRVISSEHAKIMFSQGAYYLSDVSTNGVLNHLGQPIGKGELKKLNRGDVYIIGPYRIEVSDIKLTDPEHSLRDAGLAHLLNDEQSKTLTPLDYAQKSDIKEPLNFSFDAAPKSQANTLKAYDFMPEPIDLLLSAPTQASNPCIPEDVFAGFDEPKTVEVTPVEVKEEPALPVTTNLPMALAQSDFLTELCRAFNLDRRLLGAQTEAELYQKIISLLQGVLSMVLELRALDQSLQKTYSLNNDQNSYKHNPFKVAVSQRQLFELIMRDDPEFLNSEEAFTELRQSLLPRLQKLITHVPEVQRKLLATLAPQVIFANPSSSKFNVLQGKNAWQAYQMHYQNLAADSAREWLQQFNGFMKEKL